MPEQKIRMIKQSLRCFVLALLGLIPFIGIGFAVVALWNAGSVRAQEKHLWNAAKPFRLWGVVIAGFGLILWSGYLIFLVYHIVTNRGF